MWRSKLSPTSALFFLMHYLNFFTRMACLIFYTITSVRPSVSPSDSGCFAWVWFITITGQMTFICLGVLFVMRVFVFYGRSKYLLVLLIAMMVCELSAEITINAITVPKILTSPSPLPIHNGTCVVTSVLPLFADFWLPALLFQSILFILVMVKFVRSWLQAPLDSAPLLVIFVWDGTWAFTVIFAVLLWANLAFRLSVNNGIVALTWVYAICGFCGSRVMLNLRLAAWKSINLTEGTSMELQFQRSEVPRTFASGSLQYN